MLQVRRAVLRPRLRRSHLAAWIVVAVVAVVAVGAGIGALLVPPPAQRAEPVRSIPRRLDDRAAAAMLREEIRQLSLAACEARVEVDRMLLRNRCEEGTARRFECDPGDGQIRIDRCSRFRPPGAVDRCPFPGSC